MINPHIIAHDPPPSEQEYDNEVDCASDWLNEYGFYLAAEALSRRVAVFENRPQRIVARDVRFVGVLEDVTVGDGWLSLTFSMET